MRILLVEDEHRLSEVLKKGLIEEGYAVDQAFDGEEGLFLAQSEPYDLIVLDGMLPKMEGVEVAKNLRTQKVNTPILMLTAKTQLEDKVLGFESGVDDYLTKPFAFAELRVRLQALLRRSHNQAEIILSLDTLRLDPSKHIVTRSGKELKLTPKEFSLLELLLRNKDQVITRTQIIEHVWDYNFESMSNVVDVFLTTLRKKVDAPGEKKLIHTVHGVGYRMCE